jgi:hypothetical protein
MTQPLTVVALVIGCGILLLGGAPPDARPLFEREPPAPAAPVAPAPTAPAPVFIRLPPMIAFVSPEGKLTTLNTDTGVLAQLGDGLILEPGTNLSITQLFSGGTAIALQEANTHFLWTVGPTGDVHNTQLPMMPGSSPSIVGARDAGEGWVIAYADNTGQLRAVYQNPNFLGVSIHSGMFLQAGTSPSMINMDLSRLYYPTPFMGFAFTSANGNLVLAHLLDATSQIEQFSRVVSTPFYPCPGTSPAAFPGGTHVSAAICRIIHVLGEYPGLWRVDTADDGTSRETEVLTSEGFNIGLAPGTSPAVVPTDWDPSYAIHAGNGTLWIFSVWRYQVLNAHNTGIRPSPGANPAISYVCGGYEAVIRDDVGVLRFVREHGCNRESCGDFTVSQYNVTIAPGTNPVIDGKFNCRVEG